MGGGQKYKSTKIMDARPIIGGKYQGVKSTKVPKSWTPAPSLVESTKVQNPSLVAERSEGYGFFSSLGQPALGVRTCQVRTW